MKAALAVHLAMSAMLAAGVQSVSDTLTRMSSVANGLLAAVSGVEA
jgi:hypothetical protein